MLVKSYNSNQLQMTIKLAEEIKKDYLNGFSIEMLAQTYGLTFHTVRQILLDNNVPIRQKNNKISK